jgi:hypothetical protein
MTDTKKPIYTEAQYNRLTPEEQQTLQEVATHLTGEPITTDAESLQRALVQFRDVARFGRSCPSD